MIILHFGKIRKYLFEIKFIHINFAILNILIETLDLLHDIFMVHRKLEDIMGAVFKKKRPEVFLGVWRNLMFFIVQFLMKWHEHFLLLNFLFLTLFFCAHNMLNIRYKYGFEFTKFNRDHNYQIS